MWRTRISPHETSPSHGARNQRLRFRPQALTRGDSGSYVAGRGENGGRDMDEKKVDLTKRQPLFDRDAQAYEPPASYTYAPEKTARQILKEFRASQHGASDVSATE